MSHLAIPMYHRCSHISALQKKKTEQEVEHIGLQNYLLRLQVKKLEKELEIWIIFKGYWYSVLVFIVIHVQNQLRQNRQYLSQISMYMYIHILEFTCSTVLTL